MLKRYQFKFPVGPFKVVKELGNTLMTFRTWSQLQLELVVVRVVVEDCSSYAGSWVVENEKERKDDGHVTELMSGYGPQGNNTLLLFLT